MVSDSILPVAPREAAILQALEMGYTRRAAAAAGGIGKTLFYRMLGASGTFADAVEMAESVGQGRATALVMQAAYGGNWTAAAWWLERRYPDEFGRRLSVDFSMRDEVARLAGEMGIDVDEAVAEAERVLAEAR